MRNRSRTAFAVLTVTGVLAWHVGNAGQHPRIGDTIGYWELGVPGSGQGNVAAIAADSRGWPHILYPRGGYLVMYDCVNGVWSPETRLYLPSFGVGGFNTPHLEIHYDIHGYGDIAWASGISIGPSFAGLGLLVRTQVGTAPSAPAEGFSVQKANASTPWEVGEVSVDPWTPRTAVLSGGSGAWAKFEFDPSQTGKVRLIERGQMNAINVGERNSFWVSKAGHVPHADGTSHAVWYGASVGFALWNIPSGFQSTFRQARGLSPLVWADNGVYPAISDKSYVEVCSDNVEPLVAYIISDFYGGYGVYMNVINGDNVVRDPTNLIQLDATGSSGIRAFAPQLAPAQDGGVFAVWTSGRGYVMVQHIDSSGSLGEAKTVCQGSVADICTDNDGNIHLVYRDRGIWKYRKIRVLSFRTYTTIAKDFNGDRVADLCQFWPSTGEWWILDAKDSTLLAGGVRWGAEGMIPLPGYYHDTNEVDLAVYDPEENRWYIAKGKAQDPDPILYGEEWGVPGCVPVPGDYDGDGLDDLAVYDEAQGKWYIVSVEALTNGTGAAITPSGGISWGGPGMVPVPGDYDDDGVDDLAVYMEQNGAWYIRSLENVFKKDAHPDMGSANAIAVNMDVNGDGIRDLVLFDPVDGTWNIRQHDGLVLTNNLGTYPVSAQAFPVPGDYDGDGVDDFAVYDPSDSVWHIRTRFGTPILSNDWGTAGYVPVPGDYDGDGRDDLAVYDEAQGKWYIVSVKALTNGTGAAITPSGGISWGGPGMVPVPGDYDDDGVDDLALYDEANGKWYIVSVEAWTNNTGVTITPTGGLSWGGPGLSPAPGDYNKDGKSDLGLYGNGSVPSLYKRWYVLSLGNSKAVSDLPLSGHVIHAIDPAKGTPSVGQYDATNSRPDIAIWDPDVGWTMVTPPRTLVGGTKWGGPGMVPVPGNFNDDPAADLVVYSKANSSAWWGWDLQLSQDMADGKVIYEGVLWGTETMLPIAGDFSGNGQNNPTVIEQVLSGGYPETRWYILLINKIESKAFKWGIPDMIPVGSSSF